MKDGVRALLDQPAYGPSFPFSIADADNLLQDHEAQSGAVLLGIQDNLQKSLKFRPNIVMINGGTNNANLPKDVDKVYDQMRGILEDIWEADGMENTCIILSTLLPTSHPTGKKNRLLINDDYRKIVKEYEDKKCIYLADMEPEGKGADFISIDKPCMAVPLPPLLLPAAVC